MFWRENPLTEQENHLLNALFFAHNRAAFRPNISTQTVQATMYGSGDYGKAIAGAILTLGGVHAPLAATLELLNQDDPYHAAGRILEAGKKVPGWGSSFVKGEPDQEWAEIHGLIESMSQPMTEALSRITLRLYEHGKVIYPNPSAYTAAVAIILHMPQSIVPWLLIAGRLAAWSELCLLTTIQERT